MSESAGKKPVLLFDGVCNLCTSTVIFVIKRDPEAKFLFAPLQSDAGQKLIEQFRLPAADFSSFVLIEGDRHYTKSTAALHVFKRLSGFWPLLYVLIAVPKPIRDAVYKWIAKNRYKWFGKKEQCMVPTPDIKARFLE